MSTWLAIARAEWRYWLRSRLALSSAALLVLLLLATTAVTALRIQAEADERHQLQAQAEAAFRSQPARHPHRMVHYGHYVFRAPAPLALFDPGLDPVTGQSIFLEGHRQNTAMFAATGASADLGALSGLTPAWAYQCFAPLLILLLGHAAVVREREAGTLGSLMAQGLSATSLLAGKALALVSVVALLLLPLAGSAAAAVVAGEAGLAALLLLATYAAYLLVWVGVALLASALLPTRAAVLAALCTVWLVWTLVLPAVAASGAAASVPLPGKLETDLRMLRDLRGLSDGHNANDPAFQQLRQDLLAQHGVARVEDLPVNLRGIVAQVSEQKLTATLNRYAEQQRAAEVAQAQALRAWGWLTPWLAVAEASRALAGTDLAHHHRFLHEAEALRYDFVQGLNRVHAEKLAYQDDVRRSSDREAEARTRVDPRHWQLLQDFSFQPAPAAERAAQAAAPGVMLGLWLLALAFGLRAAARRVRP